MLFRPCAGSWFFINKRLSFTLKGEVPEYEGLTTRNKTAALSSTTTTMSTRTPAATTVRAAPPGANEIAARFPLRGAKRLQQTQEHSNTSVTVNTRDVRHKDNTKKTKNQDDTRLRAHHTSLRSEKKTKIFRTWYKILVSLLMGSDALICCAKISDVLNTSTNCVFTISKVTSWVSGICPRQMTSEESESSGLGRDQTLTPKRVDESFQPSSEASNPTRSEPKTKREQTTVR